MAGLAPKGRYFRRIPVRRLLRQYGNRWPEKRRGAESAGEPGCRVRGATILWAPLVCTRDVTDLTVDLNCDVGESFGAYTLGQDACVMPHVTSANIACGFHAGDPSVMRRTVRLAVQTGVAVGAHPGLPDLVGFGRRELQVTQREVEDLVAYQIGALAGIAAAEGALLRHVKPHGALYNMAARDRSLADAIARAILSVDRRLVLVGLSGSHLLEAGRGAGLMVASEVFADRAYDARGGLVSRGEPGALVTDPDLIADRVLDMIRAGAMTAASGERVDVRADTVCVHGDTPGAPDLAERLRAELEAAGVRVAALATDFSKH